MFYVLLSIRAPFPTLVFFPEVAEAAATLAGVFAWFGVISWLDMRRIASNLSLLSN